VIGPRPLRRVLAAMSRLEPMSFRYIDTTNTLRPDSITVTDLEACLPSSGSAAVHSSPVHPSRGVWL
jgi:hypothetical protein